MPFVSEETKQKGEEKKNTVSFPVTNLNLQEKEKYMYTYTTNKQTKIIYRFIQASQFLFGLLQLFFHSGK